VDSIAALHEQLPACPQSVGRLRHAVTEFAGSGGASAGQCATIALAVSEALSNAVIHAYADCDEPGDMVVEASLHDHSLEVVVCDQGGGMRPRPDSPGAGLGLPLIASVTEQLEIRETSPGVAVHMTFAIGDEPVGSEPQFTDGSIGIRATTA
jgi:anti-sigma regulatory factor (Ser/Thr protein kinase)